MQGPPVGVYVPALLVAVRNDVLDCVADDGAEREVPKLGLDGHPMLLHEERVLFNNLVLIGGNQPEKDNPTIKKCLFCFPIGWLVRLSLINVKIVLGVTI